jgi:CDGSH-type Zn-finger protein
LDNPKIGLKSKEKFMNFEINAQAGKQYFWCTCGLSNNGPFCDGSHKGSGMKSLPFIAEETQQIVLCGCKKTKNPPFCDGSHNEK